MYVAVPSRYEGRFAVVTDVEAGCGGRVDVAAWFLPRRRTTLMRTVKSRGPGTPMLVSRVMRDKRIARTVAKKPGAPGRTRSSRRNHRAGNAGMSRLNLWYLPPAFFEQAGHGCGQRPAFPVPSTMRGQVHQQKLGRNRRREKVNSCLPTVIARSEATKQSRVAHDSGLLRFARNDVRAKL